MKLNKQEQATLKERYRKEMEKVWKTQDMVDYCVNKAMVLVELDAGLFAVEKQSIKKRFCFGYSLSQYDSESYDNANQMAGRAMKDPAYFTNENLKKLRGSIKAITGALKNRGLGYMGGIIYMSHYKEGYDSKVIQWSDDWERRLYSGPNVHDMSESDARKLLKAYWAAYRMQQKKIKTYLKRYGLDKVESWTYWRDR